MQFLKVSKNIVIASLWSQFNAIYEADSVHHDAGCCSLFL